MEFSGKNVLITGGGGGLGMAIARKFYEQHAKVYLLDQDEERLQAAKAELPNIYTVVADLQDWESIQKAVVGIGSVDYLINNAAVAAGSSFMEITEKDMDTCFGVNVKAVVRVSQCVAKTMLLKKKPGTIVNIASILGSTHWSDLTTYEASKAALLSITRAMAAELGPHNIRVNSVSPNLMETPLTKDILPAYAQKAIDRQIVKRLLTPEETADTVLFLCSSKSSMIIGGNITVDGGYFCT